MFEKMRLSKCTCGSTKRPVVNYLTDEIYGIPYAIEIYCASCEMSTGSCSKARDAASVWNSLIKQRKQKK